MSDYCTVRDVEVLLGYDNGQFSDAPESNPSLTDCQREITQVTGEIDFALKRVGITSQPTNSATLARLRNACSYGVACRIGMGAFGNSDGVNDSQPSSYCEQYQEILDDIKSNPDDYKDDSSSESYYTSNQVSDGTTTESEQQSHYVDPEFVV